MLNILLQILDDARLTDGQGRTVDFRNTIIILTSNLGSELLVDQVEGQDSTEIEGEILKVVRNSLRPEFLNRLDDIVLFHRLFREQMDQIVQIQLNQLCKRLELQNLHLEFNEKAISWLANAGYDQNYGARPLKRIIQRFVENPLASLMLEGSVDEKSTILMSANSNNLLINGKEINVG